MGNLILYWLVHLYIDFIVRAESSSTTHQRNEIFLLCYGRLAAIALLALSNKLLEAVSAKHMATGLHSNAFLVGELF